MGVQAIVGGQVAGGSGQSTRQVRVAQRNILFYRWIELMDYHNLSLNISLCKILLNGCSFVGGSWNEGFREVAFLIGGSGEEFASGLIQVIGWIWFFVVVRLKSSISLPGAGLCPRGCPPLMFFMWPPPEKVAWVPPWFTLLLFLSDFSWRKFSAFKGSLGRFHPPG